MNLYHFHNYNDYHAEYKDFHDLVYRQWLSIFNDFRFSQNYFHDLHDLRQSYKDLKDFHDCMILTWISTNSIIQNIISWIYIISLFS